MDSLNASATLRAAARIELADPHLVLSKICRLFSEYGTVVETAGDGRIETVYGRAHLRADSDGHLSVEAEADDAVNLSYVKMGMAENILLYAGATAPRIRWTGDGSGIGVPPFFREMRVVAASNVTPRMRRIRLAGSNLKRFSHGGLHVRLSFPPPGRAPVWPHLGEDGRIHWAQGEDRLDTRIYTIRDIDADAGWVDIDIVLHEGEETPGSRFALGATIGTCVGMSGPSGSPAPKNRPLLLLGDETALPAIDRILRALPDGARAQAVIEVDNPDEEQRLVSRPGIETHYLHRRGREAGTTGLLPAALRDFDLGVLGPDLFVWAGVEYADFRQMRGYLRKERGFKREDHLVAIYWRRGVAGNGTASD